MTVTTAAHLDLVRPVGCPECGDTQSLATIETLEGAAACQIVRDDGEVCVSHDGETDVDWDSSVTLGISCQACGYEYRGDDWEQVLAG